MDAANTTSQAEQIKTDTHQTACVKNESAPPYEVKILSEEQNIIAQALDILSRRMRKAEAYFSSPSVVRDFLRLKMAELEFEMRIPRHSATHSVMILPPNPRSFCRVSRSEATQGF